MHVLFYWVADFKKVINPLAELKISVKYKKSIEFTFEMHLIIQLSNGVLKNERKCVISTRTKLYEMRYLKYPIIHQTMS